jgi:DNA-binding GntR family transcriptional regulator
MLAAAVGSSTVGEAVAHRLEAEILSGRLAPGSFLRQRAVAAHFGVREGTVREAFRRLEARGLLESTRRRGVRVAPLSAEELHDLYELRLFLEPLLARESVPMATPVDLQAAEDLWLAMERELDPVAWLELNREFHATLYEPCGRRLLLRTQDQLRTLSERYLRLCLHLVGRFEESNREHRQILDAYWAREPEVAAARVRQHLEHVRDAIRTVLPGQVTAGA